MPMRRRPRPFMLLVLALGASAISSCGSAEPAPPTVVRTGETRGSTTDQVPPPPPGGTAPAGASALLVRAFDGDSMEVESNGQIVDVRMIGINAPEADECRGNGARDALIGLIDGRDLTLVTGDEATDQFGRLLRYVWVDGVDLNARMLTLGEAVGLQNGHAREAEYLALAFEAMDGRRGMWATEACAPTHVRAVEIEVPQYNPPGRDDENALQEWVDIRNVGSQDIDMAGWILRDESSQHRYVFGDVALPAGERIRVRSGCGDDRGLDLTWCAGGAVWSNGGDTAILQDSDGNVVDWSTYTGDF